MTDMITDLLGTRVTVSIWVLDDRLDHRSGDGKMTRIVTGPVRAVAALRSGFAILVQSEVVHRGNRSPGTLSFFEISSGAIEVVPVIDSDIVVRYRAARSRLGVAAPADKAPILEEMRSLWDELSHDEQEMLIDEPRVGMPGSG
jgi:hypothetical protein